MPWWWSESRSGSRHFKDYCIITRIALIRANYYHYLYYVCRGAYVYGHYQYIWERGDFNIILSVHIQLHRWPYCTDGGMRFLSASIIDVWFLLLLLAYVLQNCTDKWMWTFFAHASGNGGMHSSVCNPTSVCNVVSQVWSIHVYASISQWFSTVCGNSYSKSYFALHNLYQFI